MLFQFAGGRFGVGFFQTLERWGFMDAIFPFALVFTVVYAILRKLDLWGEDNDKANKINLVVAVIMAVTFIYPHISGRYRAWGVADPVDIINTSIPQVGVILIAIVMFLVLIGMLGFDEFQGGLQQLAFVGALLAVIYIFVDAAGYWNFPMLNFLSDPNLQAFVVILLVLGGLIYFLGSDDGGSGGAESAKNFLKWFSGK